MQAEPADATWTARAGRIGHRVPRPVLIAAAVVLVVLGFLVALSLVLRGEVLPGVTVDGAPVGGLSREDAQARLERLIASRQDEDVTFTHAGDTFTYRPGEDYRAELDLAVRRAMAHGRADDPATNLWNHLAALWRRPVEIDLPGDLDVAAAHQWIAGIAEQVDQEPFPGAVGADPATLEVTTEAPREGRVVDRDRVLSALADAIEVPGSERLDLPIAVADPPTDEADVERLAAQARQALGAPLTLTAHGRTIVLDPPTLATLIAADLVDDELVLRPPTEAVTAAFAPHIPQLDIPPQDATFEVVSGLTTFDDKGSVTWSQQPAQVEVVPSSDGVSFDEDLAVAQLSDLLAAAQREAELELVAVRPDLSTEEAQGLGITHLIGTFTTYHSCCQNRVHNIHLMADLVRGQVLRPGESFSVNDHVGRRTLEKGFLADGAIYRGEIRQEVGGGVSQFATTTFNAAFFAGLPIPDYKAHSLYISRYPLGREATLNYPSVDLEFTNDTDHGLLIHTSYTSTSITVSLFGDNGGRSVTAIMGGRFNYRDWDTRVRNNPALPEGTERVVQSGSVGYDVVVERVIDYPDRQERQEFFTRYEPQPRIVERGTGPPPAPPPEEQPSPQPTEGAPGG